MKENAFQKKIIKRIKSRFPKSIILKNDSTYIQGIPDLLILNKSKWAMIEIKKHNKSIFQPNQEYYLDLFNKMSFARMVSQDNYEEVIKDVEQFLQ